MAAPPRLLIYEYFTGGGASPGNISPGLATEALGMLWALLADFRRWGGVRTVTIFDPRFSGCLPGVSRLPPAEEVICVRAGEGIDAFQRLLADCDAALIIAPETGGLLAGLTAQAEAAGIPVLGSNTTAVALAGDKAACARLFEETGLPAPPTRLVSFAEAEMAAGMLGYPVVVKPLDGVGCSGVCLVEDVSGLAPALDVLRAVSGGDQLLLQCYRPGMHASVSLLVSAGCSLPLSLNRQWVKPGCPFRFFGGEVPLQHPAAGSALAAAQAAVGRLPGLRGYVGVDLVLEDQGAWLIEINPRLTTTYIGLRRVSVLNPARAIWDACQSDILPESFPLSGQVQFSLADPDGWGLDVCEEKQ